MKYVFAAVAASLLLVIAGCGDRADAENASTPPTQESTAETDFSAQGSEGVPEMTDITYTAILAEDARIEDSTVSLSLTDVSSEDEAGLQQDLVLNLADSQVDAILSQLHKGTTIEFTLAGNAVMTFSIPPQIPGDSVLDIKLAD
jgi:hypothetical protein